LAEQLLALSSAMTFSVGSITQLSESPGRATSARDESELESFDSENAEPNRSQAGLVTISERTPVSLATLKRDRIHCSGAEAVSIGQALCLALVTAQRRQRMNPDDSVSLVPPLTTETVFIDPTSRLGVSVDHPGDDPNAIQSVGRILSDIVPNAVRSSLHKKIISKALASPPRFGTLGELSEALAAFEQPDGRELIQAVYDRWQKGNVTSLATSDASDATPSLSAFESKTTSPIRLGWQPKWIAATGFVVAILMGGIAAGLLMSRWSTEDSTIAGETAPLLDARPIAPVTAGLQTWSVAVADGPLLSMDSLTSLHPESPVPTALAPVVARIQRPVPSPPRQSLARGESPVVSAPPIPRPNVDLPSTAPRLTESGERDAPSVRGTTDATRGGPGVGTAISPPPTEPVKNAPTRSSSVSNGIARSVTYSARDTDVTPPIPILPRLVAGLPASSPDAVNIAVVVDEQGRAYSVTGLNAPQDLGEYLKLTSALAVVKSWEFQPATKDGIPVRYRLLVPLRAVTMSTR
jgi:hypothetical protein